MSENTVQIDIPRPDSPRYVVGDWQRHVDNWPVVDTKWPDVEAWETDSVGAICWCNTEEGAKKIAEALNFAGERKNKGEKAWKQQDQ